MLKRHFLPVFTCSSPKNSYDAVAAADLRIRNVKHRQNSVPYEHDLEHSFVLNRRKIHGIIMRGKAG